MAPRSRGNCQPGRAKSGSDRSDQESTRRVTRGKRMWVSVAINLSPFSFRAPPFDPEFDQQHHRRQETDAGKLKNRPLLPKRITTNPKRQQTDGPKPGIPRMGEKNRNNAQCAWLFGHAHLTGETSIEIKYRVQSYFS